MHVSCHIDPMKDVVWDEFLLVPPRGTPADALAMTAQADDGAAGLADADAAVLLNRSAFVLLALGPLCQFCPFFFLPFPFPVSFLSH